MVTAYQEELLTLAELRQRIPNLRKQQQAVDLELRSLELASEDQSRYLRLAETLSEFRGKLRLRAETLDTVERQKILRLVVQEILVGADTIRIRHSIPVTDSGPGGHDGMAPLMNPAAGAGSRSYLLRTGSHRATLRRSLLPLLPPAFFQDTCFQPCPYQRQNSPITDSKPKETHKPIVAQASKEVPDIHLQNMFHLPAVQNLVDRCQCVMATESWPETKRAFQKILLVNLIEDLHHCRLYGAINHCRDPDWTLRTVGFRDIHPSDRRWRVAPLMDLLQDWRKQPTQILAGLLDAHPIHPGRARLRDLVQTLRDQFVREVV